MTLTRHFRHTVAERAEHDAEFASALFNEAVALLLAGEGAAARLILRDLVNATLGFEALAQITQKPSKSLHRMLSQHGNPGMDNLAIIFHAIKTQLPLATGHSPVDHQRAAA